MTPQNDERPGPAQDPAASTTHDESQSQDTATVAARRPFAEQAEAIRASGIGDPLPVPHGKKTPPPSGFTGASGVRPSGADHAEWTAHQGGDNVAIRLAPDVVGVDRDDHKNENASSTIAALEAAGGPLPPTVRVTARADVDPVSGTPLFRLPEGADQSLLGDPGPGVELIRHGYRYLMSPPSRHPEGMTYEFVWPDGTRTTTPPHRDELPVLTDGHVEHLSVKTDREDSGPRQSVSTEELEAALKELPTLRRRLPTYLPGEITWRGEVQPIARLAKGARIDGESWEKGRGRRAGLLPEVCVRALQLDATAKALGRPEVYVEALLDEFAQADAAIGDRTKDGRTRRRYAADKVASSHPEAARRSPAMPRGAITEERAKVRLSAARDADSSAVVTDGDADSGAQNPPEMGVVTDVTDVALPQGRSVEGTEVLAEVESFVRRFCVLPHESAYVAVTLWIAHTHFMDHMDTTGRLACLSPEPSSGKTRVLEVCDVLCHNPLLALDMSMSAFFRIVDDNRPTILLDEVDAIFTGKAKSEGTEDLRRVINNGYRVGAVVQRVGGQNRDQVQSFTVFAPVAMAGLGNLPDTLMSRSIVLQMKRRTPSEPVEPWRDRIHRLEGAEVQALLATWAGQVERMDYPELPEGVHDRDADVWEPLLMVAEAAGADWPGRAAAACQWFVRNKPASTVSLGVRLLVDLRSVWPEGHAAMTTVDILTALARLDDAPWADLYGEGLSPRKLAKLLSDFGASPRDVRTPWARGKGYRREDLWDAWARYAPDSETTEPVEHTFDQEEESGETSTPPLEKRDIRDNRDNPSIPGISQAPIRVTIRDNRADPRQAAPAGLDGPTQADGPPCPSCQGPISGLRAAAGLACISCYRAEAAS